MRKIEQQMNRAIAKRINWQSGNTRVAYDSDYDISSVYLHGHHIADYLHTGRYNRGEFAGPHANKETLRRWPTRLTKSRLRALGINVTTKDRTTYIDGQPI